WMIMYLCVFFFFQAEDGIRDLIVTGVQTCALPISLQRKADIKTPRRRRASARCPPAVTSDDRRLSPASAPRHRAPAVRRVRARRSEERRVGKECRSRGAPER